MFLHVLSTLLVLTDAQSPKRNVLVGAHYFSGWHHVTCGKPTKTCYSHFHGYTPTGAPTANWFPNYPDRIPLLGNLTCKEETIINEVATADTALDFFDMLYYDGGANCGSSPTSDPGLGWCLNSALAFMLNSTKVWTNTSRLHFFISYSNDIDARTKGAFVGTAGDIKWKKLIHTWVTSMHHPRYLKINNRPVFKILIPDIFANIECANNATLAKQRLQELRTAAINSGLENPIIGGGWQNPSIPAGQMPPSPIPHPNGYMIYKNTTLLCSEGNCYISNITNISTIECQTLCNNTVNCKAILIDTSMQSESKKCSLMNIKAPGSYSNKQDVHVKYNIPASDLVQYDFTGSYNSAHPICPKSPHDKCPRYKNSWFPNTTSTGAKIFPYQECGDYQGFARTNHSHDRVPYLANIIAGFDPRPWEEHAPSFYRPTRTEWKDVLIQVKTQCLNDTNQFGFPDASEPSGIQPAVNIYAWNEFGEGGIMAPTRGDGYMKVEVLQEVFGNGT